MPKSDIFPELIPQFVFANLRGLTLFELYSRHERNEAAIKMVADWAIELEDPKMTIHLQDFIRYRHRLNRAIYLKRLKNYLFSLVGR